MLFNSQTNRFSAVLVLICILGIMLLPVGLLAEGGGTQPPPPDSSGGLNSIVIDTTEQVNETQSTDLSFLDSVIIQTILILIF